MAEPIRVAARRGEIVESIHNVHGVAVRDGQIIESSGDPGLMTSLRSAAKPLQALPLAAMEYASAEQLAIACASHQAEPAQLTAVRSLLVEAEASEADLVCGSQKGRPPGSLHHNCSGKHAGMLAVCLTEQWSKEGYHLPDHPLQDWILGEVADRTEVSIDAIEVAIDGCGVPCFAVPLERLARAFELLDGGEGQRVVKAMRAHPELIGGVGALDTDLMNALPGWIAKRGAEGSLAAVSPDGVGIALKVEDGSARALRPALGVFLERIGLEPGPFGPVELRNSRDDVVGSIETM